MRFFFRIFDALRKIIRAPFFGFTAGHSYLTNAQILQVKRLVGKTDGSIIEEFEEQFGRFVGEGGAVAFAAARMGFFELMRLRGIRKGDEVILQGATCSVMVNAVLRLGAKPVFSDIDPDTFGSCCRSIKRCITSRTRMIVAQHSFGIPCDIEPIVNLAQHHNIFLLEDCALSFGSSIGSVTVGNFGDAALFSTDHTKPINTVIGGVIYTKNKNLFRDLKVAQMACCDLSINRQKMLWWRFKAETLYCNPQKFGQMAVVELSISIWKKVFKREGDFLDNDSGLARPSKYPYPAKMPTFLAALGLLELERWPRVSQERMRNLSLFLEAGNKGSSLGFFPGAYANKKLSIIPLRFVWSEPNGDRIRDSIQYLVDVHSTWFMSPIISTSDDIEKLGYRIGSCPISDRVGPGMVNLPCVFNDTEQRKLISLLREKNIGFA